MMPYASKMTLKTGNVHLELLALSLNAWAKSNRDYNTLIARLADGIMVQITQLPLDLQTRAIAMIYSEDPESLAKGVIPAKADDHQQARDHQSTGASGFTEDGVPAGYDTAAGSVIGYRSWHARRVSSGPGLFLAGAYGKDWPYGNAPGHRYTAACEQRGCRNVPNENNCGCGFWAYWVPAHRDDVTYNHSVVGVIEGSGKVILGENGFRCQHAVIRGLAPADGRGVYSAPCLRKMLLRYHAPVYDTVDALLTVTGTDPVYSPFHRDLALFTSVPSQALESYLMLLDSVDKVAKLCNADAFAEAHGRNAHPRIAINWEISLVSTALARQPRQWYWHPGKGD